MLYNKHFNKKPSNILSDNGVEFFIAHAHLFENHPCGVCMYTFYARDLCSALSPYNMYTC